MTLRAADDQQVGISAIVVTYNSAATLPILLDSLERADCDVHVIVADNNSSDDTVSVALGYPMVTVVETGGNLGYSGGINVGREHVPARHHVAILNPDLKVAVDCLTRLTDVLGDPTIGIAVPMLLNPDGSRFDSLHREPSVLGTLGDSVFGRRLPTRPKALSETMRRDSEYAEPVDVSWASGAALLISSDCNLAVGAWDADTYFLYSEETDYASRARTCGFRVRFDPTAVAWHIGQASGQPAELVALLSVNRVRYFAQRHGQLHSVLFRLVVALQHLIRVHDARHRVALRYVADPSSWLRLPNGDRFGTSAPHPDQQAQPDHPVNRAVRDIADEATMTKPSTDHMRDQVDHVLLTRFNLPSRGAESLIRAQDGWLQDRIALFQRHTVPSVQAQCNTNFSWIVYLDPQSPTWLLDRLSPYVDSGLFTALYREEVAWQDVVQDCRHLTGARRPMLLTSNLDNDDAISRDFVERLQRAVVPGQRKAIYLGRGLIRFGGRVYLRLDPDNAFCSVSEPWDGAQTAWRDWHVMLSRHMPTWTLDGQPAWLQIIHQRNVSNRVRGRLIDASRYRLLFPGELDDVPAPPTTSILADRLIYRPARETREALRMLGKNAMLRIFGKAGLDTFKERLASLRQH